MMLMMFPLALYCYKLDIDPYDKSRKFYLFNKKHEKDIGKWIFEKMIVDREEKAKQKYLHKGTKEE